MGASIVPALTQEDAGTQPGVGLGGAQCLVLSELLLSLLPTCSAKHLSAQQQAANEF